MTEVAPKLKTKKAAWLIWFFLGMFFGGHRMYLNRMGSGLFVLTVGCFAFITSFLAIGAWVAGGLFIWWIIDAIRLNKMIEVENEYILSGEED
ncbi:MAG: TM2 domain-containing protein [Kurthia sp.]|nr:TM2 domain-containing protein [Candidatus Kurthia equi]